uniref:Uncharacterized protein n=1 Tax=Leersia perrieri TaxID=77586 RepID=A0A0D9W1E7_9ORYZ
MAEEFWCAVADAKTLQKEVQQRVGSREGMVHTRAIVGVLPVTLASSPLPAPAIAGAAFAVPLLPAPAQWSLELVENCTGALAARP